MTLVVSSDNMACKNHGPSILGDRSVGSACGALQVACL